MFRLKRLCPGNSGVSLCEEDLRRQHEPWGRDEAALFQASRWPAERLCVPWHLLQIDGGTFCLCPAVSKTRVTLCNQWSKHLWNSKPLHINKTPPYLAHSSALPVFGTFSQFLFPGSFICLNSFQYSKKAAAETPISPISVTLLLHDNLLSNCCLLQEEHFQENWSFSLVQAIRRQSSFQDQMLMEKYYAISFPDGGNKVGTERGIQDFTFSVLEFEIWYTVRK